MIVATNWDLLLAGVMLGAGWVLGSALAHFAVGFTRGAYQAIRRERRAAKKDAAKAGKVAA